MKEVEQRPNNKIVKIVDAVKALLSNKRDSTRKSEITSTDRPLSEFSHNEMQNMKDEMKVQ